MTLLTDIEGGWMGPSRSGVCLPEMRLNRPGVLPR